MNPKLAEDLLEARLSDRLAAACRRRRAAAAAPPAALRQRWGARLVSLGLLIAQDPDLFASVQLAHPKGGGSWSSF